MFWTWCLLDLVSFVLGVVCTLCDRIGPGDLDFGGLELVAWNWCFVLGDRIELGGLDFGGLDLVAWTWWHGPGGSALLVWTWGRWFLVLSCPAAFPTSSRADHPRLRPRV